jgi:copper chaperone
MESISIKVGGMSCQGCVKNVQAALAGLAGVSAVEVSLADGEARVSYDPASVSADQLRGAVEDAGFDAA